jgi:DNA-binding YbaB/EbfC family protein
MPKNAPGGQPDMNALLKQAQKMQEQLLAARAEAETKEVEGQAGGGMVKVRVTGGMEFQGVTIDPAAVDPDDVSMLEDLVLAAIRDAVTKAGQMQAQLMAAQEQAASTVVEGVAGGGAVRIAVTGAFEFQSVTISPDAVDPDDVEMLQDLILAALRDAADEIQGLAQGGLDLGGLGSGLFG